MKVIILGFVLFWGGYVYGLVYDDLTVLVRLGIAIASGLFIGATSVTIRDR